MHLVNNVTRSNANDLQETNGTMWTVGIWGSSFLAFGQVLWNVAWTAQVHLAANSEPLECRVPTPKLSTTQISMLRLERVFSLEKY